MGCALKQFTHPSKKQSNQYKIVAVQFLLEFTTYGLCDHTTADDSKRYKSLSSYNQEHAADPLKTFQDQLLDSDY